MLDRLKQFFVLEKWAYAEAENGLRVNFGGKSGQWRCFARVRDAEGQVVFYSFAPIEVPEAHRASVMEFVTRANFGLSVGNFELNLDTGLVQFRTSVDVEGTEESLTATLLKHLVYQNVLTMDRYLPGITAVAEGRTTPEAAIAAVE